MKRKRASVWVLWFDNIWPGVQCVGSFEVNPNLYDTAWLGEGEWVWSTDNLNLGLRTV